MPGPAAGIGVLVAVLMFLFFLFPAQRTLDRVLDAIHHAAKEPACLFHVGLLFRAAMRTGGGGGSSQRRPGYSSLSVRVGWVGLDSYSGGGSWPAAVGSGYSHSPTVPSGGVSGLL